jgi:predicted metal-dependent hydrolase
MVWRGETSLLHDGAVISVGDAPVRLKVNRNARRISVRIDARRREAVATAPSDRRLPDAARFAESRSGWIAAHLAALPKPWSLAPGAVIEVYGAPCRLEGAAMRVTARIAPATAAEPARLIASGDGVAYARAAVRVLKAEALRRVTERTAAYAAALGEPMPEVAIMDARMRWGSCRKAQAGEPGRARYNWRLILAPPWVLDYVAAHEAAHLIEANHSPAYWAIVKRLFGDHRPARAWLRANGAALHAMGVQAVSG